MPPTDSRTPNTVNLPRHIVNQLLELATNNPHKEICGLISGQNGHAKHCYPTANETTAGNCQFLYDPQQSNAAIQQMRERGEDLFAIYHSHPNMPVIPTIADIKQLAYPEAITLIISLQAAGTLQMRAFFYRDNTLQATNVALNEF